MHKETLLSANMAAQWSPRKRLEGKEMNVILNDLPPPPPTSKALTLMLLQVSLTLVHKPTQLR